MRNSKCTEHGPYFGHVYQDEDTGEYVGRCLCGAVDPGRDIVLAEMYGGMMDSPLPFYGDENPPF